MPKRKQADAQSKSRAWVFTWNNYSPKEEAYVQQIPCQYLVYGREVGEKGTPHLQGFIYFKSPRKFGPTRARFKNNHLEKAMDNLKAIEYCKKDGNVFEKGEAPTRTSGEEEKERWETAKRLAIAQKIDDEEMPADIYVRCYRGLKTIAADHAPDREQLDYPAGIWIYGKPGSGKTHLARNTFPKAYKLMTEKWWDGYTDQEAVVMDDLDPYHKALGKMLKDACSSWPFRAQTKGGTVYIRPKHFVITSQYLPEQIWDDPETVAAIRDRCVFKHVVALSSHRQKQKRPEINWSNGPVPRQALPQEAPLSEMEEQEEVPRSPPPLHEDWGPLGDADSESC